MSHRTVLPVIAQLMVSNLQVLFVLHELDGLFLPLNRLLPSFRFRRVPQMSLDLGDPDIVLDVWVTQKQ
jgi:hypothetical protein